MAAICFLSEAPEIVEKMEKLFDPSKNETPNTSESQYDDLNDTLHKETEKMETTFRTFMDDYGTTSSKKDEMLKTGDKITPNLRIKDCGQVLSTLPFKFKEITIHEPKVLPDDQDIFCYNSPIILTDVMKTQLPPCASCYQPSQYLCRQTLKEAYCSRGCQVKCLIEKKKIVETDKRKDSNQDDYGEKPFSLDNIRQSAESPSSKDEGFNFDDTSNIDVF